MALQIISAKKFTVKLKCTIHASGKLGFTDSTAEYLKFGDNSAIKFATDDQDESSLYLINSDSMDEDSFKVSKAGEYFYVNAKSLFDSLDFNYVANNIMFDMIEAKDKGMNVYKLKIREKPRRERK